MGSIGLDAESQREEVKVLVTGFGVRSPIPQRHRDVQSLC